MPSTPVHLLGALKVTTTRSLNPDPKARLRREPQPAHQTPRSPDQSLSPAASSHLQFPGRAAPTRPLPCPLSPRTLVYRHPSFTHCLGLFPPGDFPAWPNRPVIGKAYFPARKHGPPKLLPSSHSELFPSLGSYPRGGSGTSSLRRACLGGDEQARGFTLYPGITCTKTSAFTPHPPYPKLPHHPNL